MLYGQILPNSGRGQNIVSLEPRGLVNYSEMPVVKMFNYFFFIETVVELELNIAKVGFSAR